MSKLEIRNNPQSGQVLLVLVLLIALVITLLTALSYRLTSETQSTKSQEENVRVLAAADSGIEKGISLINNPSGPTSGQFTYSDANIGLNSLPGIDPLRSRVIIADSVSNQFVSPEVPQDDQYTFYVSNYPNFTSTYSGNLIFYYGSDGAGSCNSRTTPALEVSIIYGANNDQIERFLYESCTSGLNILGTYGTNKIAPSTTARTVGGVNFSYNTSNRPLNMNSYTNAKLVIVRTLFAKTRVAFASGTAAQLPSQGKLVRSEAVSKSGTSKIVTLQQSYPQIPADFFVTTF